MVMASPPDRRDTSSRSLEILRKKGDKLNKYRHIREITLAQSNFVADVFIAGQMLMPVPCGDD